jgi:hypothetical protein
MFHFKRKLKAYIDRAVLEAMAKASDYPALKILSELHGHARTREVKLPVAADGSPLPWYTYPAIEFFNQLRPDGLRIFEYGSGNSSLYWANKGAKVWSVEHDTGWHETMRQRASALQDLLLRETPETYAAAIETVGGEFDIIVIDGAWRNESAAKALPRLKAGGMLILDNSDWYTDVSQFLKSRGFFQIDFSGFGPINDYCWTTSVLLRATSILAERVNHPKPIGGIDVYKADKW